MHLRLSSMEYCKSLDGCLGTWKTGFRFSHPGQGGKASENLLWMCKKATEAAEKAAIIKQKKTEANTTATITN